MKYDIVYILKNNIETDEIRYSLRSVEKNFPYRKIWFYGGCPEGITPDEHVEMSQKGANKWEKVNSTLKAVCKNDDITEDFWLFNDDFFVMKKTRNIKPYIKGTLQQRVRSINNKHGGVSTKYSRQLAAAMNILVNNNCDQLDYALHIPMLINREKGFETIRRFPMCPMFRSLYGNYWKIGGEIVPDVKVFGNNDFSRDTTFLSTDDKAFERGPAGEYIRNKFNEPSKYEEDAMT